ncbi:hypothetical protein D7X74_24560 [Corallococcus sp. CA047B]|uniref:PDZ domain-containing protein n=1 Tax=Corallococcus sp. CA047B TaxID=2316729 RepID=UPI000EA359D9|nr:PDZ domain-containing protein [Corallococcus sp. CA047B]RKH11923.1 hypothetical protein D7X74_24560 [Corallococcus sp. CA047B]
MPAVCLLLSAVTSLFTTTWLLAAAPFTVAVEPVGFSVRSDGARVSITQVVPGGPADRAGLEAGMRVQSIVSPVRAFAQGPIGKLGRRDLHDALQPTWDEPLILTVGKTPQEGHLVSVQRDDARPAEEFPPGPLTLKQLERLTLSQQARYHPARFSSPQGRDPEDEPSLTLHHESQAWVKKGQLQGLTGGGHTGLWIHPQLQLDSNCPARIEKVELRGLGPGLPRTLTPAPEDTNPWQQFDFDLPLWSLRDVTKACAAGKTSLTASLRAALSCQGEPVLQKTLPVKLTLTCHQPPPEDVTDTLDLVALRGEEEFLVGAKAVVTVEVMRLDTEVPQVEAATVVEVDDQGKELRRVITLPVPAGTEELKTEVTLDTTTARTVRLAAELRFPDGSTRRTTAQQVPILTPELVAARQKEEEAGGERLQAFTARFSKEWKSPCANVPATVAWLQKQPEIASASGDKGGHHFSYQVKGSLLILFDCHQQ